MTDLIPQFGSTLYTLLAFIVALSIIVAVHEFGHYIVARWSGIKAEVFSIGFGPRLFSRVDRHGTLWQVAALPLGGYVRFMGDENAASAGPGRDVDPALRRQTLAGAPLWARFATLLAGPVFNFILSILIFAGFAMFMGLPRDQIVIGEISPAPPQVINELQPGDEVLAIGGVEVAGWTDMRSVIEQVPPALMQDWRVRRGDDEVTVSAPDPMPARVSGVGARSAAAAAGIMPGDVILAVGEDPIDRFDQLPPKVAAAEGQPLVLSIWREGQEPTDVTVTPKQQDLPAADGGYERRWLVGITGGDGYFTPDTRSAGPLEALWLGIDRTWSVIAMSISGLWAMISGQIDSCNLGGAISIAQTTGQAASAGGASFVTWIAFLSAAIGFLNLLPIPVLDGGHLMFYSYEAVTGRPPSDRALNLLTAIGFAAVIMLMIFGLSNDLFCP
ncbi:RIP metalloprotease RseP [Paracoccus tegillarcae]|uniref:Zinc metalloprotease n=1 Tax=Paracoccus tegillarcae TaxID=1529068 RepID=A0A2K9ESK8_9RHOB|nr:RIP metalloprotease RseP [Paracoccus tegillarcae]AUH34705.1 RIP metalloprotease RseP [Paracoccus tegillarcae]